MLFLGSGLSLRLRAALALDSAPASSRKGRRPFGPPITEARWSLFLQNLAHPVLNMHASEAVLISGDAQYVYNVTGYMLVHSQFLRGLAVERRLGSKSGGWVKLE
jgi:hypothetical protein